MKNHAQKVFFYVLLALLAMAPIFYLPTALAEGSTVLTVGLVNSKGSSVTISYYVQDDGANVTIVDKNNDTGLSSTTYLKEMPEGSQSHTFSNLSVGSHTFTVKAELNDLIRQGSTTYTVSSISGSYSSTPQVSILSPQQAELYSSINQTLKVNYYLNKGATLFILDNNNSVYSTGKSMGSYEYTFNNLTVGTHQLKFKACDSSNITNCSEAILNYTVIDSKAIANPSIKINSPALESSGTSNVLTVNYTFDKSSVVSFYDNDIKLETTGNNGGTYIYSFKNLTTGSHGLKIKVCASENVSLCSEAVVKYTVLVTGANNGPKITLVSPASESSSSSPDITVNYKIDSDASIYYIKDGQQIGGTGQNAGSYIYVFKDLATGSHNLVIKACKNDLCNQINIKYTVNGNTSNNGETITDISGEGDANYKVTELQVTEIGKDSAKIIVKTNIETIVGIDYNIEVVKASGNSNVKDNTTSKTHTLTLKNLNAGTTYAFHVHTGKLVSGVVDYEYRTVDKKFKTTGTAVAPDTKPDNKVTYSWVVVWSECVNDFKTKTVECKNNSGTKVADSYCLASDKPVVTQEAISCKVGDDVVDNGQPNLEASNFKLYSVDTLQEMKGDPKINEPFYIIPNIKSNKSAIKESFWYKVYLNDQLVSVGLKSDALILNSGSYQLYGSSQKWLFDKAGIYKFKLVVDSEKQITETNEDDNVVLLTINLGTESATSIIDYLLDTDKDGLTDYQEGLYGTDKTKTDTDDDGYDDLIEIKGGYSPMVAENAKSSSKMNIAIYSKLIPVSSGNLAKAREQLITELKTMNAGVNVTLEEKYWTIYVNALVYGGYTPTEIFNNIKNNSGDVHPSIEAVAWRGR